MLEDVTITADEVDFMRRSCPYIPAWFFSFLKGFRYDSRRVRASQDDDGHLRSEEHTSELQSPR